MFPKWPIFTKLKKTLPALAWFQYPLTLCEDSGECHRVRLGLRPSEAPHRVSTIGAPGGGRGAGTCSPAANTYSGGFVTRNHSSRKSSHLCSGTTFHCSPLKVTAFHLVRWSILSQFLGVPRGTEVTYMKCPACGSGYI